MNEKLNYLFAFCLLLDINPLLLLLCICIKRNIYNEFFFFGKFLPHFLVDFQHLLNFNQLLVYICNYLLNLFINSLTFYYKHY